MKIVDKMDHHAIPNNFYIMKQASLIYGIIEQFTIIWVYSEQTISNIKMLKIELRRICQNAYTNVKIEVNLRQFH